MKKTAIALFLLFLINGLSLAQTKDFAQTEIKMHNGVPTLFINGTPNAGLTYMTYKPVEKHYASFGKAGVDLASLHTTTDYHNYFNELVWIGPGQYDYSIFEQRMQLIMKANPNAYVFPRVYLCSPPWWNKEHPEEVARYYDGVAERSLSGQSEKGVVVPSWASEKWREDTAESLRRFILYCKQQPYADRIIGFHIASGSTEEWYYWNTWGGSHETFLDYSTSQLMAFRKWLRNKYRTDLELQNSWHKPDVTLATAMIPSPQERDQTDFIIFRDPVKEQNVIDYYIFHSEIVVETIDYFAKIVKEETQRRSMVGVFYGYIMELGGAFYSLQNSGHLAIKKLLDCPDVDFLTAPSSYRFREPGTGFSTFMSVTESIKLHGKIWMEENDYRTHLLPVNTGYGRTENLKDSEAAQSRQLANVIAHGAGMWWFDMGGGWFDEPDFMKVIEKLNSIGEKSISFNRASAAEIAVVLDEKSMFYTGHTMELSKPLLSDQRPELGKIGAPFDYILVDDLDLARPYKMYIFLNAFHVTPSQLSAIKKLPSRGAKAVLWVYAPGFAGETLNTNGCFEVTGLRIGVQEKFGPLQVAISKNGASQLPSVQEGITYGMENTLTGRLANMQGPLFYGDDPSADVLGLLYGHDLPGLIRKNINGTDVYYSAAPKICAQVLRGIAANAGVHIYNYNDDVMYFNSSFLAIHTAEAGMRTIRLPRKTGVYDVYNDKVITMNAVKFDVDLPVRNTAIYFLGTEQEWKK